MGTSAFILTDRDRYNEEKFLADTIVSAFHADASLTFDNYKVMDNGVFSYTTLTMKSVLPNMSNYNHFIMYVKGKYSRSIDFGDYDDLGLDSTRELVRVGTIEEVYDSESLIFRFVYEYLKLNPNDYFWVADYDWVYRLEDMEKLYSLPYNPEWFYTDPVLL